MEEEKREGGNMPAASVFKRYAFFGSYDHTLDAKGRIIIPTAYRKPLGESFTITLSPDDKGIALYPDAAFERMVEELLTLNQRDLDVQKQINHVAKYSFPGTQADPQGRVLLPVCLRQYVLEDVKDLEISGALDHVRIVPRTTGVDEDVYYKKNREEILNKIAELNA